MSDERTRVGYLDGLRQLDGFISAVAHDLNNPIAGILGYCHLLSTEADPSRVQQYAAQLGQQAVRCRDLISRVQACVTQAVPNPSDIPIGHVISGALVLRAKAVEASGVEVEQRLGEPGPVALADLELTLQALGHLLDNALAAASAAGGPRPGRVLIVGLVARSSNNNAECARIEVHDSGPGIEASLRERVFDPTYTTRRSGNGVGLGLPTALSLTAAMDGWVSIGSSDLGGACVSLELPMPASVRRPPSGPTEADPAVEPEEKSDRRARVLCIDDEPFILDIYGEIFALLEVDHIAACDLSEAAAVIERERIDLIISDFRLPDGLASELFERLQADHPKLTSRFVVCTGDPHHPDILRSLGPAQIPVLAKPFTVMDIKRLLHEVL